jgi:hypothetical protein
MPKNLTIQPEGNLPITRARERTTSIVFRCRKAWAIFLAVTVSWAAGPVVHAQINPTFLQQIAAIHAERESRTPAQKKIHSQLLFAARQAAGLVPVPGAVKLRSSLRAESDGRFRVKITATVTPELLTTIHSMGGTVLNSYPEYRAVYALVPPSKFETLAARADVAFIGVPSGRSLNGTSTPTAVETSVNDPEGDVAHAANIARTAYGVTGAGVKVGVLSDNLNDTLNIYGTALNDGYVTTVTVPPGQAGSTSEDGEGLAMLEVVHRIAPGATLYFATGDPTEEQMATNIKALKADGCQIICDDVSYFDENPFQDGVIAQAVDAVTAGGALYFSCAANYGNLDSGNASCWEGNFVGTTDYPNVLDYDSVYGDANGVLNFNSVNSENSSVVVDLFWPEPAGKATSQYDLYEINAQYQVVQEADDPVATTGLPTQQLENVAVGDTIGVEFESGSHEFLHLQISAQNSYFGIATDGRVAGHNAMDAPNSFSVAATPAGKSFGTDDVNEEAPSGPYYGAAPKQFTASSMVEPFSDDGPRRMFFTALGAAFTPGNVTATGGRVFAKPDFTAADGVSTSDNDPNFGQPFFGTSCATPHAAAMAALAWSYNPALTPSQLAAVLRGPGCLKISAPGPGNRDAGAGILMATRVLAGVAAASAPVVTSFTPASGPVGTKVVITGTNFSGLKSVEFGGSVFSSGSFNATHIYTTVPTGAETGVLKITNLYGSVATKTAFTVTSTTTDYTVTPTAGANGAISPAVAQKVAKGGNITFTATPNAGYAVYHWLLNGAVAQDGGSTYALDDVAANDSVEVTFIASSGPALMISPVPGSTLPSSTVTFKWSAGTGVTDYDLYVGTTEGGSDIFNAGILPPGTLSQTVTGIPTNGSTIYVTLWSYISDSWQDVLYTYTASKPTVTYTVTPSAGADGVIAPSAAQKVSGGGSITFTATPDPGYEVSQWLLNGALAQSGGSSYTLKDVAANDTVKVTFIAPPPVATSSANSSNGDQ